MACKDLIPYNGVVVGAAAQAVALCFPQVILSRFVSMARDSRTLTMNQILTWAERYNGRRGRWPEVNSGEIPGSRGDNWKRIDNALRLGLRGLPGGSSLAKLLAERRGTWNRKGRPLLNISKVVDWAKAHRRRTGSWPTANSGPVHGVRHETWSGINGALVQGSRGFPGGETLARLLQERCGVRNRKRLPPLTVKQILKWGEAYHRRHGFWPNAKSGAVREGSSETWGSIAKALYRGRRGQPGGQTLAGVFARHHGARIGKHLPCLRVPQILRWADEHRRGTGTWPTSDSGVIVAAPEETWAAVNTALRDGSRGLPGESSLAKLLHQERRKRHPQKLQRLSVRKILSWADDHHRRTGRWPVSTSGEVLAAPGETWSGVSAALGSGSRGLTGVTTLPRLLHTHRQVRNTGDLPKLTIKQILRWADAHHRRTGEWPHPNSGPIPGTTENWLGMQTAFQNGSRGMPGGTTLPQLLARYRNVRNRHNLPDLSVKQVLQWVDEYYVRHKRWPQRTSGPIPGSNGETWQSVFGALYKARRGFRKPTTLAKFLDQYRRPETRF